MLCNAHSCGLHEAQVEVEFETLVSQLRLDLCATMRGVGKKGRSAGEGHDRERADGLWEARLYVPVKLLQGGKNGARSQDRAPWFYRG